jgi:hypothetical protein
VDADLEALKAKNAELSSALVSLTSALSTFY